MTGRATRTTFQKLACVSFLIFSPLISPVLSTAQSLPSLPTSRPATTRSSITFDKLPRLPRPFSATTRPVPEGTPRLPVLSPSSISELKSLEEQVEVISQKCIPATVCLQIGPASGSGVIISSDGYILTAGHVSGEPNQEVTVVLHTGKRVKAITLGANNNVDSGLARMIDPGPWPYVEIGDSHELRPGQWLISIGHPGGYKAGRSPVVRLGRMTQLSADTVTTDNTLVGGDSGGPLFDLDGRVVGIHSRIAPDVTENMHVAVDMYVRDWDQISSGVKWGTLGGGPERSPFPNARIPHFGAQFLNDVKGLKITSVTKDSPADRAGLRPGDIIFQMDEKPIKNFMDYTVFLMQKRAGDLINVRIQRPEAEDQTLKIRLGEPQNPSTRPNRRPFQPFPNP